MSILNLFSENIILPVSDILTGQSVYKYLSFLNKSQFWSRDQIDRYQTERLRQLLEYAYFNVPFYHDYFSEFRINLSDIKTKADLSKLPILYKTTIKNEGISRFSSNSFPTGHLVKSSSSGATGEPLFYLTTKDAYSFNLATSLRGWYWMGYRLGDKYIKLSQNPRKRFIKRLQDKMSRNFYLPTNPLIDSNFKFILDEIEQYKPKVIRCYPDPLHFLARYKKSHPEYQYKPLVIATTGNTLYPEIREEIEAAFGCKIFDAYSCEGNSIVYECPTHTCYHSAEEYGISEVIDEQGNPVKNGIGRLISTDLWNYAHPFIRYDTQDLVEVSDEPCSCGRKHLRINRIIGRDNDVLTAPNGRKFIVHNFTGFFQTDWPQVKRAVDQFQIVQKNDGSLALKLVVNKNFDMTVKKFVENFWEKEFTTPVEIVVVENISLTSSGKRKFVIKEK